MIKKKNILGVNFTDETKKKVLEHILHKLKNGHEQFYIVTPNPELVVYAQHDPSYKTVLNEAELCLPDGIGISLAGLLLGKRLPDRIPGADFVEYFCKNTATNPVSIGFLGGRDGVAEKTAQRLKEKYPWINVAFVGEEWKDLETGGGHGADEGALLLDRRGGPPSSARSERGRRTGEMPDRTRKFDILFVAFGSPKQEQWIAQNLHRLPVTAALGVGGAFDFISGKVSRAPQLIRTIGLEWLFRLIRQPWRFKRQLALLEFIRLVFKEFVKERRML